LTTSSTALVVEEAAVVAVLHAIGDLGHVGQAQDRAVLLADHDRLVVFGFLQLVVGAHLPVALLVFDKAHGPALVGVGHGGAHIVQGQAVLVEQLRFQLDAHGRQRTAADLHLPTPLTWDRLWDRMVSARSYSCPLDSTEEVSDSTMIGACDGLIFL
jgi:hypothetical protein